MAKSAWETGGDMALEKSVAMKEARPRAARKPSRAPTRRSQEERSTGTRRRLIDAAIAVLREDGYANLTITKVTQRAGLTNGAMQHHFPSRDELLLALLDTVYPILQIPFDSISSEHLTARERIARLVDILWSIYSRPEYLVVWDIALGSRGEPKLWARVRSYQREISQHMRAEFARLFADYAITEDDAERVLAVTVGCIRGIAFQSMFGTDQLKYVDFRVIGDLAFRELSACARSAPQG
jgi:AcrR family transcriptional regulator